MRRLAVPIALWLALAFVAWNVIYDRYVAVAAIEFTREQIVRHQRGEPVTSIHAGFSPRLTSAAWRASAAVSPILAAGAVAVYLTFRKRR